MASESFYVQALASVGGSVAETGELFLCSGIETSSYFTPQTVVPVVAQTVTVGGAVVGERGNDRAHALVGVA